MGYHGRGGPYYPLIASVQRRCVWYGVSPVVPGPLKNRKLFYEVLRLAIHSSSFMEVFGYADNSVNGFYLDCVVPTLKLRGEYTLLWGCFS